MDDDDEVADIFIISLDEYVLLFPDQISERNLNNNSGDGVRLCQVLGVHNGAVHLRCQYDASSQFSSVNKILDGGDDNIYDLTTTSVESFEDTSEMV